MKKIMQRFFGVLTSVALLVTSATPVFAASGGGHDHGAGLTSLNSGKETTKNPGDYTITLSYPEVDGKTYEFDTNSHYGAFQIFSGTVKGTSHDNPGTNSEEIPITDIKWGNAFGESNQSATKQNIVEFVYALATASTGPYKYAFSDFTGFEKFFDGYTLKEEYGIGVTVNVDTSGTVTSVTGYDNVNFDKLAVAVADVLAADEHLNNHEWLQAFTDILGGFAALEGGDTEAYHNKNYATQYYEGYVGSGGTTTDTSKYTIYVPAGYYMIRDLSSIGATELSHAYSARMLFVADNVNQILKVDVPRLDKEILRGSDAVGSTGNETEVAGVGDVVHFQLHGTLPSNYDEYLGGYQYKFIDTLSNGLDLVTYDDKTAAADANDCIKVTVKGLFKWNDSTNKWEWTTDSAAKTITLSPTIYTHTGSSSGSDPSDKHLGNDSDSGQKNYNYNATYTDHTLTVEFPCLKEIRIQDGTDVYRLGYYSDTQYSEIYVDYYAKVNQNAVVSPKDAAGDNGNYNQAQIEYSDNPQAYGDTDKTREDRATVYIFGLDIIKIDAAEYLRTGTTEGSAALEGAKFALVRPVKNADGTAVTGWEIAKFTFIDEDEIGEMSPAPNLPTSFEKGYYSIESWETITTTGSSDVSEFDPEWLKTAPYSNDEYNIATLSGGILNVSGLDAGVTYTMVETATPDSTYAKIDPFTITLTAETSGTEYTGSLESAASDGQKDSGASFSFDKPVDIKDLTYAEGSANMLVANFKYIDLPSTGGVGTYLFYIIGGGIIVLSAVLFILSKKKTTK